MCRDHGRLLIGSPHSRVLSNAAPKTLAGTPSFHLFLLRRTVLLLARDNTPIETPQAREARDVTDQAFEAAGATRGARFRTCSVVLGQLGAIHMRFRAYLSLLYRCKQPIANAVGDFLHLFPWWKKSAVDRRSIMTREQFRPRVCRHSTPPPPCKVGGVLGVK